MKNGPASGTALCHETAEPLGPTGPSGRRKGIAWDAIPELGVIPDTILAQQLGCTPQSVGRARKQRGMPACDLQSMRFSVLEARWRIARTYTQVVSLTQQPPPRQPVPPPPRLEDA